MTQSPSTHIVAETTRLREALHPPDEVAGIVPAPTPVAAQPDAGAAEAEGPPQQLIPEGR